MLPTAKTSLLVGRMALLGLVSLIAACGVAPMGASVDAGGYEAAAAKKAPAKAPAKAVVGAPAGYYARAEAQSGQGLLRALYETVHRHKELSYNDARDHMYAQIDDPDGDDVIECIYTGKRLSGVKDRKTAYRQHKGFDAEHVWPQSMGGDRGTARSDLHHLFSCDMVANSIRNNHAYGEVKETTKVLPTFTTGQPSRLGLRDGQTVFQPRPERRGDVARALMYVYVSYIVPRGPERVGLVADGISTANFDREHDTILRWHQQDPVSAEEMARNNAIYKLQGNRNPFIDRPDFVAKVGRFEAPMLAN